MALDYKDYYAALGVARDANADDIKKAFRKLARLYHPDVAKDKRTADAKFKEINEANEVLSDPEKRAKYDLLGTEPPRERSDAGEQDFHFGGTGFSDFFEHYFSGGTRNGSGERPGSPFGSMPGRGGPPQPQRGGDIAGDLLVTLDEAMRGALRPLSMRIANPLTGQVETRTFTLRIPPGAIDGRRLRVPAHGEPGQGGGPAGDLFLRVRHAAHPDFSSDGADILHELDIAPWEAVLGAEITVPTLDGAIKLRVPAHSKNGLRIRVRARGLPRGKTGERGDFFVVLAVQLPGTLDADERLRWENFRDQSTFHPRTAGVAAASATATV